MSARWTAKRYRLYQEAGLSLEDDLETLHHGARISANPASVDYLERNIIFEGNIHIPVLTMHSTGDALVSNQNESAYRQTVEKAGREKFLRQIFVHRAGHGTTTPAENLTALGNLINRLDTGHWPDLQAGTLNADAAALGTLKHRATGLLPFRRRSCVRLMHSLTGDASATVATSSNVM